MKNTILLVIYLTVLCSTTLAQHQTLYNNIEFHTEDICVKSVYAEYLGVGKDIYADDMAISEVVGYMPHTSMDFMLDNSRYYVSLHTALLQRLDNIPLHSILKLSVTFYKGIDDGNNNPFAVITDITPIAVTDIYEDLCFNNNRYTKEFQATFCGRSSDIPNDLLPEANDNIDVELRSVIYFRHHDNAYALPSIFDCDALSSIEKFDRMVIRIEFYENIHAKNAGQMPFAIITSVRTKL